MGKPIRKLTINGQELTMRQASELPGSASYQSIVGRCQKWRDRTDLEIVFTKMMSKSGAGRSSASHGSFGGNKKYQQDN